MKNNFVFKEITHAGELKQFLHLRYETYLQSVNSQFIELNDHHLDLNVFDIHSKHYALFCENSPAGYIRIVIPRAEYWNTDLLNMGFELGLLSDDTENNAPYPFLSYEKIPKSHWDFYYRALQQKERVIEGSRLIVLPEFRATHIVKFLFECSMALYRPHAFKDVVNCRPGHCRFYQHYGFNLIGNETYKIHGIEKASLSLSQTPDALTSHFDQMAFEYYKTQEIKTEL